MKMRCLLVAIGLLVTPLTAWAEDAALEQRMKKLEDEVRQYKEELRTYQEQERREDECAHDATHHADQQRAQW